MTVARGEALHAVPAQQLLWALGSICSLHRMPFSAELVAREFPPPCTHATVISAGRALGLKIRQIKLKLSRLEQLVFPLLVGLRADANDEAAPVLGIVTAAADGKVVLFHAGHATPQTLDADAFAQVVTGVGWLAAPVTAAAADPDGAAAVPRSASAGSCPS
jgi:subfamily B ATP-binding cassette protein HlyB/CyaB